MEAIHGRHSLSHNFLSGGILGYTGVQAGLMGVPFVNDYTYYRYPFLRPPAVAFFVYGSIASCFAGLGGKRL